MSRDPHPRDMFVNCVLSSWLAGQQDDTRKLGELISTQLGKQVRNMLEIVSNRLPGFFALLFNYPVF